MSRPTTFSLGISVAARNRRSKMRSWSSLFTPAYTLEFVKQLTSALKLRRGRFLMLVGNEYNLPWAQFAEKRDFLRETATDYVGTQMPLEAGQWLYADTGARVLALPHALNEAAFRRDKPDEMRAI